MYSSVSRYIFTWIIGAVIFGNLHSVAMGVEEPVEREWKLELAQIAPEVPQDLWEIFMKGLKTTETYDYGQAMRADKLGAILASWSEKLGVRLHMGTHSFLGQMNGLEVPLGEGRCAFRRCYRQLQSGKRVNFFCLETMGKNRGDRKTYRVPRSKVAPLDFEVAYVIHFSHPILGVELEYFSVEHGKLSGILETLFEKGGVKLGEDPRFDFSMNGAADSMELSITARKRDAVECIAMAVEAGGWKMTVNGRDPRGGFHYTHFNINRIRMERKERRAGQNTIDLTRVDEYEEAPADEHYFSILRTRVFEIAERFAKRPFRIVIGPRSG